MQPALSERDFGAEFYDDPYLPVSDSVFAWRGFILHFIPNIMPAIPCKILNTVAYGAKMSKNKRQNLERQNLEADGPQLNSPLLPLGVIRHFGLLSFNLEQLLQPWHPSPPSSCLTVLCFLRFVKVAHFKYALKLAFVYPPSEFRSIPMRRILFSSRKAKEPRTQT